MVIHEEPKQRFVVYPDDKKVDLDPAVLSYQLEGTECIHLTSTQVPETMKGQGVGKALAKAALDYSADQTFKVKSSCWFVDEYIQKNPKYKPLIT